jgi:hypothetical protein
MHVTWKVGPLHIIQNEISPKRSKKTKIYQRSTLQFSMIFQIRLKNNTVNFLVIRPLTNLQHLTDLYYHDWRGFVPQTALVLVGRKFWLNMRTLNALMRTSMRILSLNVPQIKQQMFLYKYDEYA